MIESDHESSFSSKSVSKQNDSSDLNNDIVQIVENKERSGKDKYEDPTDYYFKMLTQKDKMNEPIANIFKVTEEKDRSFSLDLDLEFDSKDKPTRVDLEQ